MESQLCRFAMMHRKHYLPEMLPQNHQSDLDRRPLVLAEGQGHRRDLKLVLSAAYQVQITTSDTNNNTDTKDPGCLPCPLTDVQFH